MEVSDVIVYHWLFRTPMILYTPLNSQTRGGAVPWYSSLTNTIRITDYLFPLQNTTGDIRIDITANMDVNELAGIHGIQPADITGPADNMVNMPTDVRENYHWDMN